MTIIINHTSTFKTQSQKLGNDPVTLTVCHSSGSANFASQKSPLHICLLLIVQPLHSLSVSLILSKTQVAGLSVITTLSSDCIAGSKNGPSPSSHTLRSCLLWSSCTSFARVYVYLPPGLELVDSLSENFQHFPLHQWLCF